MGCGSSLPAERVDGGRSTASAASDASSPAGQTVTVASKPTKTASRLKDRRSSSQPVDHSRHQSSLSQPSEQQQRHSNHAVVPLLVAAAALPPASSSSPPATAHPSSSSLSLPEPAERGDGRLRPSVIQQRITSETASAQHPASPRSAGRAVDARPVSPPSESSARATSSPRHKSKGNSISSPSPSLLERQQRGSSSQPLPPLKTLPPLKMKGRASTSNSAAAAEGWMGKDEAKARAAPASPRVPKRQEDSSSSSPPDSQRAPEKAASPRLSKMMSRSSVMLPALARPPTARNSVMGLVAAAPPKPPPTIAAEYQQQLDANPALWSSPTLLSYYPELVFSHYAAIGAAGGVSEFGCLHRKAIARLARDAVDEWLRVWRLEEAPDRAEGRKPGRAEQEALQSLCRVLAFPVTERKVDREAVNSYVTKRLRQDMKADEDGRISRAAFINGWKAAHARVFGLTEKEPTELVDNPLACNVM